MNKIIHFEIHAKDQDRIQKFYEDAFGWKIKDLGPEMGQYRLIDTGPVVDTGTETMGINGGMSLVPSHEPVDGQSVNAFVCIVGVNDILESVEKVKNAGGIITEDVMDMPTIGKLAYCKDPEGNLFGIIEPVPMTEQKQP
ncbi:MAG: VOC family protein [Candidatus Paceibacterota bacterium]|jgi:hypothetical protein